MACDGRRGARRAHARRARASLSPAQFLFSPPHNGNEGRERRRRRSTARHAARGVPVLGTSSTSAALQELHNTVCVYTAAAAAAADAAAGWRWRRRACSVLWRLARLLLDAAHDGRREVARARRAGPLVGAVVQLPRLLRQRRLVAAEVQHPVPRHRASAPRRSWSAGSLADTDVQVRIGGGGCTRLARSSSWARAGRTARAAACARQRRAPRCIRWAGTAAPEGSTTLRRDAPRMTTVRQAALHTARSSAHCRGAYRSRGRRAADRAWCSPASTGRATPSRLRDRHVRVRWPGQRGDGAGRCTGQRAGWDSCSKQSRQASTRTVGAVGAALGGRGIPYALVVLLRRLGHRKLCVGTRWDCCELSRADAVPAALDGAACSRGHACSPCQTRRQTGTGRAFCPAPHLRVLLSYDAREYPRTVLWCRLPRTRKMQAPVALSGTRGHASADALRRGWPRPACLRHARAERPAHCPLSCGVARAPIPAAQVCSLVPDASRTRARRLERS
eukprot:scaffold2529_cov363-Prasinococcus_capsulatus_cf.AAC.14